VILEVPYVKGASQKLKRALKKTAGVDVVVSGGIPIKQRLCSRLKPARNPMEKQGSVYMIPWKDCPIPYIGETRQPLAKWIGQHKASTARGDMENGPANHSFSKDHRVDFKGTAVLDVEGEQWLRKTKEALYIRAANPQKEITRLMNLEQSVTVSTCWDWALPEIRSKMEQAQTKSHK
jgi:hypothetical protein